MKPTIFLLLALCVISCRAAEEEYEYEDEPVAAPVTPAPTRPPSRLGGLLSARGRTPAARKPTATTTTTVKPIEQVDEQVQEGDELIDENSEHDETPTTTTEATKKLRAGGVRPFRSNEDLLAALKRRRAQVGTQTKEPTTTHSQPDSTTAKPKSSGGRNRGSANDYTKPTTRSRFGGNNRGKSVPEEVQETQQDEVQVKAKPYRRG